MPTYTGQRDGLHWWDTEAGPFGLAPDMAAQFMPPQPEPAPAPAPMPEPERPLFGIPAVPDFQRTAAPAQDLGASLAGGPATTVSNDYKGKGAAKRREADQGKVAQLYPQAQPEPAPQEEQGPAPFDGSLESAIVRQGQAYDQYGQAVQQQTDVEAYVADQQAGMMAQAEQRRLAVQAEQDKARAAEEAQRQKYAGEVSRMVDEHTKKEVDRGRLWKNASTGNKVALAISVAMAGLGSAMKGQGDRNPALDVLMAAINNDVNDQMSAIEKSGADVQMRQGMYQQFLAQLGNKEAARNATMARGVADAQAQLGVALAQTGSARARANGQVALAELGIKRGELENGAAQALFGRDMQLAQLEEQRKARAQAAANAARSLAWDKQKFMLDREADIAAAQAKGDGARAAAIAEDTKDLQARGIFDPRTGKPMLQPEGEKLWQEAEALRAKGDAAGAAQLESSAIAQHSLRTGDGSAVRKVMGSVQNAVTLADDVSRMREKYGANWTKSSEGEQWMTSKAAILAMTLKDAYQLGALDKGSQEVIGQITGGDPAKLSATDIPLLGKLLGGAKGNKGSLDAVVDALSAKAQTDLRAVGYRGEWKPRREPTKAPVLTADEQSLKGAEASEKKLDGFGTMGIGDGIRGRDAWGAATVGPQAMQVIDNNKRLAAAGNQAARGVLEAAKAKGGGLGRAAEAALAELDSFVTPSGHKASRVGSRLAADGSIIPPAGTTALHPGAAR